MVVGLQSFLKTSARSQDIEHLDNGNYYFQECEYECDQAKARKLEDVVMDLKAIVKTI